MFKLALTICLLGAAGSASAATLTEAYQAAAGLDAEFQIFVNSRPDPSRPGAKTYDTKYVSHPGNIVPANMLYPTDNPVNAICFFGNPDDALKLFRVMSEAMGTVPRTWTEGVVFLDPARNLKPWLQIDGVSERGDRFRWFDRVRRCDAPATAADRVETPVFLKPYAE